MPALGWRFLLTINCMFDAVVLEFAALEIRGGVKTCFFITD